MIFKKSLTLLLLAAFGFSAIAPAPALALVYHNGALPYIAQDAGVKTNGAKPDVNVVDIVINEGRNGFDLASGDLVGDNSEVGYDDLLLGNSSDGGRMSINGAGSSNAADSSAYFLPPMGCKFVPLPGYISPNRTSPIKTSTGEDVNLNISVTNPDNLPGTDSSATYVFVAQVLKKVAYGNPNVPRGALAIHGFTDEPPTPDNPGPFNEGPVSLRIANIGLACDATDSPTTSGNLEMTYVKPTNNNVKALLKDTISGIKIPIATYTTRAGKLEALIADDRLGGTNGVLEDSQINTLVSNTALSTVSLVNFGPSEVTGIIDTTKAALDIDAILIRAAEVPTGSITKFFQTPFATAQFRDSKNLSSDSADLRDANLANSNLFDNESNALITVDLEITSFTGDTSSATLAVHNAFVGLETTMPSIAKSSRRDEDGTAIGIARASVPGFLGAVAFDQFTTSTGVNIPADPKTMVSILSVDPASASGNHVVDGRPVDDTLILTAATGFVEGPALIPDQTYTGTVDADDFVSDATANSNSLVFADATLVNPDRAFLFPGVFIDNELNNVSGIGTKIININARSTTSVSFAVNPSLGDTNLNGGQAFRNSRTVFSNLTPASASSGAQYHIIFGSEDVNEGGNDNTAKDQVVLGETEVEDSYDAPALLETVGLSDSFAYENNVILASKLTSAVTGKKFTVHILPFINKYDGERDVISVRPKGTITLNPAALTEGVKLIAKVYGNNLNGTTTLTLASIDPSGSGTTKPGIPNIVTRILPVSGDDKLMVHTTGTPALGRDTITVSQVDGDTTADDTIEDIIGSGKVLDTTVPPLFGGGVAGNALTGKAARGPIPFIQPKGRVLAIEEAASGDFKAINDLGITRIRITLPAGTDLNLYGNSATAHQNYDDVLAIFGTGGFSTPITVANNITNVQKVSSTNSQAFIDIDLPTTSNPPVAIKRGLYLVFRPDALVVPKGLTNLNVSVSIVDVGTTAAVTDDKTLSTVGSVALAPALSNFLSVAFSQTANSAYRSTDISPANEAFVRPLVETKYGSQVTTFTTPISKVVRFVNNDGTPDQNNLWDIVISEGVADAFPVGTNADGYPSTYINGTVTKTEVLLHCLLSNPAIIDDVAAQTATALVSDSSIVPGTLAKETGVDNGFILPLTAATLSGAPRAVDTKSTVTVSGIKLETTGNLEFTDTDIACWTEVDATAGVSAGDDGIAVIGSPVGRSIGSNATITDIFNIERFPLPTNVDAVADLLATQRLAGSRADASDTAFDTNYVITDKTTLARSVFNTSYQDTSALISKGIGFIRDDVFTNARLLNSSTEVTVTIADLPPVNGTAVTGVDKQLTLSVPVGTLEPGTLITVSTTSPAAESVIVPVLDNGSFKAVLRSSPTAILTLTQTPVTNKAGAKAQIKKVDLSGVKNDPIKNDPKFNGVVPTLLNSTIAKRGTVVALFNTPAVTGFDFADVENTAKVNGVAVTKITTGKYAAIVPATASTYTLTVIVDGKLVTTTLNLPTVTAFGQVLAAIGTVNVKADDNVVVNLLNARARFPSDLSFEIVYTDGTTAVVANSAVTFRKAGARAKFANPQAAKAIAFVQAVSSGGSIAKSVFN
jgi:hypothetical protein